MKEVFIVKTIRTCEATDSLGELKGYKQDVEGYLTQNRVQAHIYTFETFMEAKSAIKNADMPLDTVFEIVSAYIKKEE